MMADESSNSRCRRKRNTNSRNRPNAHLAVVRSHGARMVEDLPSYLLCRVSREAKQFSRSGHVGHVRILGTFGATQGQR